MPFRAIALCFSALLLVFSETQLSAEVRGTTNVIGEGPARTGSDEYRDGGADGTGVIIAVIDNRFAYLESSQANGDSPPWSQIIDTANYSSGGLMTGDYTHGTKCLENIYDHAPGAEYCLYTVNSGRDASDLISAINRAINHDVDIISMSVTYFNQGWEDGSGDACAAVKAAADNGILVFAAAGNFAYQHWRGGFYDPDSDNYHNWSGTDEAQDIKFNENDTMPFYLQWNTSGGTTDYNLYLYDDALSVVLDSSVETGSTPEYILYGWPGPGSRVIKAVVKKISGSATRMQLFVRRGSDASQTLQYITGGGSISSPANSDEANVLAIGAVDEGDYGEPPYSNVIMGYSSMGPSNSDRVEPDLVSPTNCNTSFGTQGGTSGATPNAAGTAAAFWSSVPDYSATGVRYLLLKMAGIFKDWGVPGTDTVYGAGGINLYTYHAHTEWVDRDVANIFGYSTVPYFYVSHAQDAVPAGGRIVFLGGLYPEQIVLDKAVLYESIGGSAVLGQ